MVILAKTAFDFDLVGGFILVLVCIFTSVPSPPCPPPLFHAAFLCQVMWDLWVSLVIVWSVVEVTFRLGFDRSASGGWLVFSYFVDVLFFLDMVVSFRTALLSKDGIVVAHQKQVAIAYFKVKAYHPRRVYEYSYILRGFVLMLLQCVALYRITRTYSASVYTTVVSIFIHFCCCFVRAKYPIGCAVRGSVAFYSEVTIKRQSSAPPAACRAG